MIAPLTMDALCQMANALGFTIQKNISARKDIGIDEDRTPFASHHGRLRLGSDISQHAVELEFEGTARECNAFLIGFRDAQHERMERTRMKQGHQKRKNGHTRAKK